MKRIVRTAQDLRVNLRAWVAKRRLRAQNIIDLTDTVVDLRKRVGELETDLDELRADSRRVAEMRIQLEDFLADQR